MTPLDTPSRLARGTAVPIPFLHAIGLLMGALALFFLPPANIQIPGYVTTCYARQSKNSVYATG